MWARHWIVHIRRCSFGGNDESDHFEFNLVFDSHGIRNAASAHQRPFICRADRDASARARYRGCMSASVNMIHPSSRSEHRSIFGFEEKQRIDLNIESAINSPLEVIVSEKMLINML